MPIPRLILSARTMRTCLVLAFIIIAVCASVNCTYAQYGWWMEGHDPQHTGRSNAIGPDTPVEKWKLNFFDPGQVYSSAMGITIGVDGVTYVNTERNTICAVNPDGSLRWKCLVGLNISYSPAIGPDGTIYVVADYDLHALNPDGSEKWIFEGVLGSPIIGPDGTIYVGNLDGAFTAINPNGSKKWEFVKEHLLPFPKIGLDGTIYVHSWGNKLYAIHADGSEKWESSYGAPLAIGSDGTLYTEAYDDYYGATLFALNADGSKKWEYDLGSSFVTGPALCPDGTIYVEVYNSNTTKLYAIRADGSKKWECPIDGYSLEHIIVDSEGTAYVNQSLGLYAITASGSVKWQYGTSGSSVIGSDGTLYVRGYGILTAIGQGKTAVPPYVNISMPSTNGTITGPETYTLTYTNATAVTLDNSDIKLNLTGTAKGTVTISGTGNTTRKVTISNITGNGTIGISIAAGTASNSTGYSLATGPSQSFEVTSTPIQQGAWSQLGRDAQHSGLSPYVGPTEPIMKWRFDTQDKTSSYFCPVIGADGTVYVSGNQLFAISSDGTSKWQFLNYGDYAASVIGPDGVLYLSDGCGLYSVSSAGHKWWQFGLGKAVSPSVVGSDGTIYVGSGSCKLSAVKPNGLLKWEFTTDGDVCAAPAVSLDGTIYATSINGKLYAITPDGLKKWELAIGNSDCENHYLLTIGLDGTIYVSAQSVLYAVRPDGSVKWEASTYNTDCAPTAIGPDGTIYIISDEELRALSTNGTDKWQFPIEMYWNRATPAVDALGTVYVGSSSGLLYAINPNGLLKWSYQVPALFESPTAIGADGTLYVVSYGGMVYAIGSDPSLRPEVSIGAPSVNVTASGPVSYMVAYPGSTSVTFAAANVHLNKTGTVNGTVSITGSGNTRTVTISNITGDGTLGISVVSKTASNAAGFAPAAGPSAKFLVFNQSPSVRIESPSVTSTKSGPLSYPISYSWAQSITLTAADVILNKTGTANGTVSVTGTGTGNASRKVTISHITGEGTLGISIRAGTASNPVGNAASTGPSYTVPVVRTCPGIAIGPSSSYSTSHGPVRYTVNYDKADYVSLTAADITLNKTGTANGTLSVTGTGKTTRTVTISNITGNGSLGISLKSGTAFNAAGLSAAAGPGAKFDVVNSPPGITISAPSARMSTTGSVSFTVNYTSATSVSLLWKHLRLNNTGTARGQMAITGIGMASRTVTISNIRGHGTLGISISARTASNVIGFAPAAGPSATCAVCGRR